jgi:ribonuclease E
MRNSYMLETENSASTIDAPSGATPPDGATAPPRRARRAVSRPAGPPTPAVPDPSEAPARTAEPRTVPPAAETAEVPAKRARKAAAPRKKAAAKTASPKKASSDAPAVDAGPEPAPARRRTKAAAAAPVIFQAPEVVGEADAPPKTRRRGGSAAPAGAQSPPPSEPDGSHAPTERPAGTGGPEAEHAADEDELGEGARRKRRRRGGRGRRKRGAGEDGAEPASAADGADATRATPAPGPADATDTDDLEHEGDDEGATTRRRRRRRRRGSEGEDGSSDSSTVVHVREPRAKAARKDADEVTGLRGSTRLEAKKQRRREGRDSGRRRPPILSEAQFLARRESVRRVMVVRQRGDLTQIAVLEDDVLVEHYVASTASSTMVGNVFLGRVQNVLPSMEAAFVDIGRGRNAVLYAGEVNWDAASLDGQPKRIEHALKSGDSVLVQVTKDPVGHKGSRLTSNVSLAGRFLVYVPDGSMSGISRKLPDTERTRLKAILKGIVPDESGVIVRTAAEGATEDQLTRDVTRLRDQWDEIDKRSRTASAPSLLYGEPDLTVRVVRDLFNEDFEQLVVSGDEAWNTVQAYVGQVAPDLMDRVSRYVGADDVFTEYRVDEQVAKGLDRKVWLPSGGSLVIDRTEAMTVIDVNTGKFVGKGSGNLEETVTRNNLEAAEEIVRQLRLRDIGGIIVIDFIDMVLESNRELVLRRMTECLGRDRTKHQVAEVTSLGLVQMTRKRIGQGLLEAFSEPCEHCNGRGVIVHIEPVEARSAQTTQVAHHADQSERVARVARATTKARTKQAAHDESADAEPVVDDATRVAEQAEPTDGGERAPAAAPPRRRSRATRPAAPPDAELADAGPADAGPADAAPPATAPTRRRRRAVAAPAEPVAVG